MDKKKILKVTAIVEEEYVEPDNIANYKCPYCGCVHYDAVYEENYTFTETCNNEKCNKKFKVKIPKFY